jgi:hypothetical protein
MKIVQICPQSDYILSILAEDGRVGQFDVRPYLTYEAFEDLRRFKEFMKVFNGGYFVEWDCGTDLSVDTIEARWQVLLTKPLCKYQPAKLHLDAVNGAVLVNVAADAEQRKYLATA